MGTARGGRQLQMGLRESKGAAQRARVARHPGSLGHDVWVGGKRRGRGCDKVRRPGCVRERIEGMATVT